MAIKYDLAQINTLNSNNSSPLILILKKVIRIKQDLVDNRHFELSGPLKKGYIITNIFLRHTGIDLSITNKEGVSAPSLIKNNYQSFTPSIISFFAIIM